MSKVQPMKNIDTCPLKAHNEDAYLHFKKQMEYVKKRTKKKKIARKRYGKV